MSRHRRYGSLLQAVLGFGVLALMASPAPADEASYCVTCKNPDQVYRCHVTGLGSRPTDAQKLYCVIRTAKDGNHASCAAERSSAACNGVVKVYSYEGPAIPEDIASDPRLRELGDRISKDRQAFDKPKGQGPKTLVELGGRAVSASRDGLRSARTAIVGSSDGEAEALSVSEAPPKSEPGRIRRASAAVGSFARQSYRCMRSLFRNCSGETDAEALE